MVDEMPELGEMRDQALVLDSQIRAIAAACSVNPTDAVSLRRRGVDVDKGDPWPFDLGAEMAPIGSRGWWNYVATVLAVAHNTGVIDEVTRNRLLDAGYQVAVYMGSVR